MVWAAHADINGTVEMTQEQFDTIYSSEGWFTTTPPPEETPVAPSSLLHYAGPWAPSTQYFKGDLITSPDWGLLVFTIDTVTDVDFNETGMLRITPDPGSGGSGSDIETWTSTGAVRFSRKTSGDPFPFWVVYDDKQMMLLDGQTDPDVVRANTSAMGHNAKLIVQGQPGANVLALLESATDTGIHRMFSLTDLDGAPIFYYDNAGGDHSNDDSSGDQSVFGPTWYRRDIYGFIQQRGSMTFRHVGPPGNAFDHATATGAVFQGSRAASPGNWVSAAGASVIDAVDNPYGGTVNPGEAFHVIRITQGLGSNMVARSATIGSVGTWVPVVPGNYVKGLVSLRSAATPRSITPFLVWCDSSGNTIAGTITGTAQTDSTSAWTQYTVGGVAPASAAGVCIQLGASSMGAGEIHYMSGCGPWVNNSTSGATDPNSDNEWSPPYCGQNDGVHGPLYACGSDEYSRLGHVATPGKVLYMLDGIVGHFYLPREVGAPGSATVPRWVSVL